MPEENTTVQQIDVDSIPGEPSEELVVASLEPEKPTEEATEPKPEDKPEGQEEEADFDLDLLDDLGEVGDDDRVIKPLESVISKLSDEEKPEYLKQLSGADKAIKFSRELREEAGTDDPTILKKVINTGKTFTIIAQDLKTPETQRDALISLLGEVETITGKTLAEIAPDLMGIEVDEAEAEAQRLRDENKELRKAKDRQIAEGDWLITKAPAVIEAFAARSKGFKMDAKLAAPYIVDGMKPLAAIRASQPDAWERHLIALGQKEGQKAAKVERTPDTPSGKKGGEGDPEFYPEGHHFAGQPKPKGVPVAY